MPLKVAIIEDNPATVRSLVQTIDWAALDCEVSGTAADGESGRQLLLQVKPDIVLTDICMPEKDGLQMLEEVRQTLPACKMIIITGYDQFQYASRAIKLAVFDYILKPIQNDEVMRTIKRAAAMTQRQQATDTALEQAVLLKRRAQIFSLLTNDSQRGQGISDMLADVDLDFNAYYIMVIQLENERVFSQAALNRVDEVYANLCVKAVTVLLYDCLVAFVARNDLGEEWRKEANCVSEAISKALTAPTHIGISKLATSRHMVRQAYQQARQALWEIVLHRNPHISNYYQDDASHHSCDRIAMLQHKIDEIIEKADLSDDSAKEAAAVIIEQSGKQLSNMRAMLALYAMTLHRKAACPADDIIHNALSDTWFVTNDSDVQDCLLKLYAAIRNAKEQIESSKQSLLTRSALQYIRLHAIEGLRLDDVADKLCVSANYLSALIRKETGVTFHEHVLEAKMSVARTMLADPRVLVDEVARAVGYGNYISFYSAFKRIQHMTPTEYRNQKVEL